MFLLCSVFAARRPTRLSGVAGLRKASPVASGAVPSLHSISMRPDEPCMQKGEWHDAV